MQSVYGICWAFDLSSNMKHRKIYETIIKWWQFSCRSNHLERKASKIKSAWRLVVHKTNLQGMNNLMLQKRSAVIIVQCNVWFHRKFAVVLFYRNIKNIEYAKTLVTFMFFLVSKLITNLTNLLPMSNWHPVIHWDLVKSLYAKKISIQNVTVNKRIRPIH